MPEVTRIGIRIVATVSDGRALVRAATELRPQLIIVDVAMPILNGLDAGQQVKEFLPAVKLVYLTMNHDADLAAEAFRRGASGYLLKTCAASELTTAVREVLRGKSYLSPTIARDTVDFLLRQGTKLIEEGERLDGKATGSAATSGRRKMHEGSGRCTEHYDPNGCLSQVPHYGSPKRQEQRRAGSVRNPESLDRRLSWSAITSRDCEIDDPSPERSQLSLSPGRLPTEDSYPSVSTRFCGWTIPMITGRK